MVFCTLKLVFLTAVLQTVICTGATDPCVSYSELPRAKYRGGKCQMVFGKEVCDSTLKTQWYKAVGLNGTVLEIQTKPAEFQYCGTKFPFWMNGTHPTVAEQEVSRTVCLTSSTYCEETMNIMVKNCSGFYVYKLSHTDSCSKGYCFGETEPCPPVDHCDVFEYNAVRYDPARSFICDGKSGKCGDYNDTQWYAFVTGVGFLNVSSTCPSKPEACGSSSSLWINDTRNLANGSDENTVCLRNSTDCCGATYKIVSKWCKGFRVYNFAGLPTKSCHAVCTDDKTAKCPSVPKATTPSSSIPSSSETVQMTTNSNDTRQTADERNASKTLKKSLATVFHQALFLLTVLFLI